MSIPLSHISDKDLVGLLRKELKNYHLADELPDPILSGCRSVNDQLETQSQPNASFAKRLALNIVIQRALDETYEENKEVYRYGDRDVLFHFD